MFLWLYGLSPVRSQTIKTNSKLKNIFFVFFFFFLVRWLFFVERGTGKPEYQHMRQKAKASHFLQRLSSKFISFLILFKSRLQCFSSRRSSRLRPAGVNIRTLSQMEAYCEKKENIWKRCFWNKELTHSQNNLHKRTARCKISRMLRTSANAFCPRTL